MTVSVILPTMNGVRYLQQAIDSCLRQTYVELELLIVDGGSIDGTLKLVQGYRDPRVTLIHQPNNNGRLPGAINLGLSRASGEFLTWTSDDNFYEPEAIATLTEFLDAHPDIDLVYTDYWRIDEQGNILTHVVAQPPEDWLPAGSNGPCFLFRRRIYESLGAQETAVPLAADYEYWLRMWKKGYRLQPLNIPLYYYRLHPDSITSREGCERYMRDTEKALLRWIGPDPYVYPSRYARLVAANHIASAFENYRHGKIRQARGYLFRALRFDPRWIGNRGVLSILAESFVGPRIMHWIRGRRRSKGL